MIGCKIMKLSKEYLISRYDHDFDYEQEAPEPLVEDIYGKYVLYSTHISHEKILLNEINRYRQDHGVNETAEDFLTRSLLEKQEKK
jgi:hypothetical protein